VAANPGAIRFFALSATCDPVGAGFRTENLSGEGNLLEQCRCDEDEQREREKVDEHDMKSAGEGVVDISDDLRG
jgi:hypothetical protein